MANLNHIDEMNDKPRPQSCLVCEAMLPDAVDGILSETEQKAFDKHVAGCAACAEELAEAQRGAAWLAMLKGHTPEPSPMLLTRILEQTTGAAEAKPLQVKASNVVAMPAIAPGLPVRETARSGGILLAFRQKVTKAFSFENAHMHFQPRLAMTAAMAFFSVALTMNMTGLKLSNLKASDFRPSALRRTVADTSASASRSFHNMRVVYQVESKLDDLQSNEREDERSHSASPYAQPSRNSSDNDQKDNGTDDQGQPRGHSSLQMPSMGESVPVRKGV